MFGKNNQKAIRVLGIVVAVIVIAGMLALTFPLLLLR